MSIMVLMDIVGDLLPTPLVLDFTMVDSNKDGAIDKDEFNKACSAGLVKADEATVKDMK
jgi:EF hand